MPINDGYFQYQLPHDRVGRFEVKLNQPESASFFYEVNLPPRHELQEANMAEDLLTKAAEILKDARRKLYGLLAED